MNMAERYSCQLPLDGFGSAAQQKLSKAKVLIVGVGGLGCPAGLYLTAMGIGTLGIADFDKVNKKNLHRQVLYGDSDVGELKAKVASKRLERQNPATRVIAHTEKVTDQNVMELLSQYDVVMDCTDNFDTRYLLNDACVMAGKPLVYGAIFQYEGQAAAWNVKNSDGSMSPNYRDVFPSADDSQIPNCADGGVIPTIAGIIGCVQANEVIKYIAGIDDLLSGKLFIFDAKTMNSYITKLPHSSGVSIKSLPAQPQIPQIPAKELKSAIDKNIYELIDVRTPEEHSARNIGGKNIPLDRLDERLDEVDFARPVVFYCASGARSSAAVKSTMTTHPEATMMSLSGGINAW
ncbi:MAG: HesA/MoeB/ThiF family protein [Patescibacteria group bacterium]